MKTKTQKKTNTANGSSDRPDLRTQIEIRAYKLWLADGSRHGNDLNHWLQAERELASPQMEQPNI